MKKCYIIISNEYLVSLLKLPKEAHIFNISRDSSSDTFKIYIIGHGKETAEAEHIQTRLVGDK